MANIAIIAIYVAFEVFARSDGVGDGVMLSVLGDAENYKNFFLLPLSFSFTHSLFPEKSSFSGGSRHTRIRRKRSFRTLLKTHHLRTVRKLRKRQWWNDST